MKQILSRLFPFGRGIIHEYPASNWWILYVDYMRYFKKVKSFAQIGAKNESEFDNFADQQFYKKVSLGLTLLFLVPIVFSMLKRIDKHNFCHYLALVNMLSFNFGYHVHEKAILLVTIPLTVMLFFN
jgi:alpha-1,3-glucosyltransferase